MAKLTITEDFLLGALFPGETLDLLGIERDGEFIVLDIDGYKVPKVEKIRVEITVAQRTHRFVAVLT